VDKNYYANISSFNNINTGWYCQNLTTDIFLVQTLPSVNNHSLWKFNADLWGLLE